MYCMTHSQLLVVNHDLKENEIETTFLNLTTTNHVYETDNSALMMFLSSHPPTPLTPKKFNREEIAKNKVPSTAKLCYQCKIK